MKKIYSLFFILSFFVISTSFADCVSLYGNITWQRINNNSLLLFRSGNALAKVDLEYGTFLTNFSNVQILDDYPCSYSDNVFLIDEELVGVRSIERL